MPQFVYLASPYSHALAAVRNARYRAALMATRSLLAAGVHVFSPIVYSHFLVGHQTTGAGSLAASWEFWREFDLSMLDKCDVLAVLQLPGWTYSVGVQAEIAEATVRGIAIRGLATVADVESLIAFVGGIKQCE